jgi:L-alanine-DL-glutamate epimerase-like enolase superfamily enzyme
MASTVTTVIRTTEAGTSGVGEAMGVGVGHAENSADSASTSVKAKESETTVTEARGATDDRSGDDGSKRRDALKAFDSNEPDRANAAEGTKVTEEEAVRD